MAAAESLKSPDHPSPAIRRCKLKNLLMELPEECLISLTGLFPANQTSRLHEGADTDPLRPRCTPAAVCCRLSAISAGAPAGLAMTPDATPAHPSLKLSAVCLAGAPDPAPGALSGPAPVF